MTYTGYIELNKVRRITRAPHSGHGCPVNFKMLAINNGGYNSLPVFFAAVIYSYRGRGTWRRRERERGKRVRGGGRDMGGGASLKLGEHQQ